jgi:hypothetical protein
MWRLRLSLARQRSPRRALEAEPVETGSDHVDDGIEIRCDPGSPNAWRKAPYAAEIRAWAEEGERDDMTVLVIIGPRMILVTPDREFDLGMVGPDDRIVRELEGTKVVGATVVKES